MLSKMGNAKSIKRVRRVMSSNSVYRSALVCDIIIPFLVGVIAVLSLFWVRDYFDTADMAEAPKPGNISIDIKNYILQENQLRDRIRNQIRNDIGNNKDRPVKFSTVKEEFFSAHPVLKKISSPNGVWSWPEIEKNAPETPLVYVVTPTYRHPYQYAELTRIAQALYPARKFIRWLVVDDHDKSVGFPTHLWSLGKFLRQFNVKSTVLQSSPKNKTQISLLQPRGVAARRTALKFIRRLQLTGTVYFADDDNTFDSDIFRQMQSTKKITVWPTGGMSSWVVSSPIVDESGKVAEFFDGWTGNRKFPLDFASFAFNASLLNGSNANIPWIGGYQETIFVRSLKVNKEDFEVLAAHATEVLTWHTKTVQSMPPVKPKGGKNAKNILLKNEIKYKTNLKEAYNRNKVKPRRLEH